MGNNRAVLLEIKPEDFHFLTVQLKSAAPHRRKGFGKATIGQLWFKSLIIALRSPNHYPLYEIIYRMCLAAVPPAEESIRAEIESLFQ